MAAIVAVGVVVQLGTLRLPDRVPTGAYGRAAVVQDCSEDDGLWMNDQHMWISVA